MKFQGTPIYFFLICDSEKKGWPQKHNSLFEFQCLPNIEIPRAPLGSERAPLGPGPGIRACPRVGFGYPRLVWVSEGGGREIFLS